MKDLAGDKRYKINQTITALMCTKEKVFRKVFQPMSTPNSTLLQ